MIMFSQAFLVRVHHAKLQPTNISFILLLEVPLLNGDIILNMLGGGCIKVLLL
jgi:hypothetical protein